MIIFYLDCIGPNGYFHLEKNRRNEWIMVNEFGQIIGDRIIFANDRRTVFYIDTFEYRQYAIYFCN